MGKFLPDMDIYVCWLNSSYTLANGGAQGGVANEYSGSNF